MFLNLLNMVPPHSRFILPVGQHSVLAAKASLVVLLGLVLLHLLIVVPANGRFVLAVRLHTVLAPETGGVVLLTGVFLETRLFVRRMVSFKYCIYYPQ